MQDPSRSPISLGLSVPQAETFFWQKKKTQELQTKVVRRSLSDGVDMKQSKHLKLWEVKGASVAK